MDIITQRLKMADINREKAEAYAQIMGCAPEDVEYIRKGLVAAAVQFDEGERAAVSYITTKDIDRDGEIVDPAGADLEAYRKNPVVLFGHDYSELPIGKNLWIKSDDRGLIAKTQYASHEFAQKVYEYRKEGMPLAQSIGFIPMEWEDTPIDVKGCRRRYKKWALLEYSDVPVPANPEAVGIAISKGLISPEYIPVEEPVEKEGRVLSSRNRTLVMAAVQQMDEAAAALRELLSATEPAQADEPAGETMEMAADEVELKAAPEPEPAPAPAPALGKQDLMAVLKDALAANRVNIAGLVDEAVARKLGKVTL